MLGLRETPREEGKMEEVYALIPILQGWGRAGSEPGGRGARPCDG